MPSAHALAVIEVPHDDAQDVYLISDLSAEFGVTTRALRFYEDEGLIAPRRRGTTRLYTPRDRARLAWILRGKRLGFSLADIRSLIDLYDIGDGRETQRTTTIAKCRERIVVLERQRHDIDAAIDEIRAFVAQLDVPPT